LAIKIANGEGVILATLHVKESQKDVVLRVGNEPSFELSRRNHSDDGDENHVPTEYSGLAIKIENEEGNILATLRMKEGQKEVLLLVGNDPSDVATPRSTQVVTPAPSPNDAMTNTSSSKDDDLGRPEDAALVADIQGNKESDDENHGVDEGDDPSSRRVIPTSSTGTPTPAPAATVELRQSERQTQPPPASVTNEELHMEGDNIPANGRTGEWTPSEDKILKVAVRTHVGDNWDTIAALVPGRTVDECCEQWRSQHLHLDSWSYAAQTEEALTAKDESL
jgi:hypothetical protein